jgi:hypothetical protein
MQRTFEENAQRHQAHHVCSAMTHSIGAVSVDVMRHNLSDVVQVRKQFIDFL